MQHAVVRTVDLTNATWYQGSRYSYPLRAQDTSNAIAFVDILKRKGSEPPPHIHHREHELFIVLSGATEFQAGGDVTVGHTGSFAFLPRGIPHRFAQQQDWGRLAIVVVPGGFDSYLLPFSETPTHLDEPPLPSKPLDIPGLIARAVEYGIEFVPPGVDMASVSYTQPENLSPIIRQFEEGELLNVLGMSVRVKLSAEESAGAVSVFMTEDPPRTGPPVHTHKKEDETIFVIDGDYKIQIGGTVHDVMPGQIAFFPKDTPHTYVNAGETTGKLLVVTTPGGFENFFRDVDALCRNGIPDTADLLPVAQRHGLDITGPPIQV